MLLKKFGQLFQFTIDEVFVNRRKTPTETKTAKFRHYCERRLPGDAVVSSGHSVERGRVRRAHVRRAPRSAYGRMAAGRELAPWCSRASRCPVQQCIFWSLLLRLCLIVIQCSTLLPYPRTRSARRRWSIRWSCSSCESVSLSQSRQRKLDVWPWCIYRCRHTDKQLVESAGLSIDSLLLELRSWILRCGQRQIIK